MAYGFWNCSIFTIVHIQNLNLNILKLSEVLLRNIYWLLNHFPPRCSRGQHCMLIHPLQGLGGLTESVAGCKLHLLEIFTLLLPFHMELFVSFSAIPSSEPELSFCLIFIFQFHFVSSRDKEREELTANVNSHLPSLCDSPLDKQGHY